VICWAKQYSKFFPLVEERHRLVVARNKLKPLPCAWNSHTKAKGALKNVMNPNVFMNPNVYLNAIVFYRFAQRGQKQKVVPEPEFKQFDLTYLTGAPRKRDNSQNTSGPGVAQHNLSDALPA
jgi:hypothetical protein